MSAKTTKSQRHSRKSAPAVPPRPSQGLLHDLSLYLLREPRIPTLVQVADERELEEVTQRIRQRIGIGVQDYAVLNIHQIGVDAPVGLVFDELTSWDRTSVWWPNHLASVDRLDGGIERLRVLVLGLDCCPIPLFSLDALRVQRRAAELDNARYVLYESHGGYPIGIFCIFVRSRIADRMEQERTQLFFAVGFNFYGRKDWPHRRLVNATWEWIHNRATANILNRLKRVCEARFRAVRDGR
ncbi:MAG: hypothetical protein ACYTGV_07030 [Planctomycetota bacterium]|jgi:hypothetical protein